MKKELKEPVARMERSEMRESLFAQPLDQLRRRIGIGRKPEFHLREAYARAGRQSELAVRLCGREAVAHEMLLQLHHLGGAQHRDVGSAAMQRRRAGDAGREISR